MVQAMRRPSRTPHRNRERDSSPPVAAPGADPSSQADELVAVALAGARKEALRLYGFERGLFATALVGFVIIALRGIAEVSSAAFAVGLAIALLAFVGVFGWASRIRGRMEHLIRDIQALEITREVSSGAPPRVEVEPYRTRDGAEHPLIVVRNDSIHRLLLKETPDAPVPGVPRAALGAIALVILVGAGSLVFGRGRSATHRWTFADPSEPNALGFHVSGDRAGKWLVEEHVTATAAHALANRPGEAHAPPATLVAEGIHARDVKASTRCKVSTAPSACGLVFRHRDDANHLVARIDFSSRALVLSSVSGGIERQLATAPVRVEPGIWQELVIEARGPRVHATCNGRDAVDVTDAAPSSGSVGLWVPASGEAYFDDLSIDMLERPAVPALDGLLGYAI
jgi:hypothetical protein